MIRMTHTEQIVNEMYQKVKEMGCSKEEFKAFVQEEKVRKARENLYQSRPPKVMCCGRAAHISQYYDKETSQLLVSHGVCTVCLQNIVLPQVPFAEL